MRMFKGSVEGHIGRVLFSEDPSTELQFFFFTKWVQLPKRNRVTGFAGNNSVPSEYKRILVNFGFNCATSLILRSLIFFFINFVYLREYKKLKFEIVILVTLITYDHFSA